MENIRVVQMGLGGVGKAVTRSLAHKKGIQLVGAVDPDPGKVGQDAGELAGAGRRLGVRVSSDAPAVFAEAKPDIVLHTVTGYMKLAVDQLREPISRGIDIITNCEELGHAYVTDTELAAELEALVREHRVTLLASGLSPGYLTEYLPLALSQACRDIEKIIWFRRTDLRPYLVSGSLEAARMGTGIPRAQFVEGVKNGSIKGHIGFEHTCRVLADHFEWKLDRVEESLEPLCDENDQVVAIRTLGAGIFEGRRKIELEHQASIAPDVESIDAISLIATPPLHMTIKPGLLSMDSTANAMVNAIPHVINAAPGLQTAADLPVAGALEFDSRRLLKQR